MKIRVALLLLPALLLAACQEETAEVAPADAPAAEVEADAVAWVNGEPITRSMLEFHLMRRTQGQPEMAGPEAREALLNELVELTLLAQEAERLNLDDDPQVAARVDNLRKAVLAQASVERLTQAQDDAALQAEYDRRYAEEALEYHARHILLEDEATAKEVIGKLEQGGDFAALAKEFSTGPTGPEGGDLGWFQPEHMVPPFAQAVQGLEAGNYTKSPVQTQFGYHVILLEGTRPMPKPELDEVRNELTAAVAQRKIEEHLNELRNQAEIRFDDDDVSPIEAPAQQPAAEESEDEAAEQPAPAAEAAPTADETPAQE